MQFHKVSEQDVMSFYTFKNTFCMLLLLMHQIMPANLQACHVAIHIKQFESKLCQIKLCNVRLTLKLIEMRNIELVL